MALTTYLANKLIDHVCGTAAYTMPTQVYLGLFTTATTDAGGGTEVTGGSYARQAVDFDAAVAKHADATADVTFTNMPAVTVTHGALFDASTGGNMLIHNPFTSSFTVAAGNSLTIPSSEVDVDGT